MKCPCPICNGKGYVYNALGDFNEDCVRCQGSGAVIVEPITNEEWFDSLSTKEKAEWLDKVAEDCCQLCDEERREFCNKCIARDCEFENAKKWEMWLKQPHREIK